jgi:hypothetical protein
MRFSLKWILAAMAYMALAAAALTQGTWVYADLLWAISLLVVVYAGLVTAFARGRRQITAAGFVVASLCFCVCLNVGGGDAVPTMRLLTAAGVGQQQVQVYSSPYAPTPVQVSRPVLGADGKIKQVIETVVPRGPTEYASAPAGPATPVTTWVAPPPAAPMTVSAWMAPPRVDMANYRRAGNAVGMMLIGGLGRLVGLAANRAIGCQRGADASPT